MARADANTRVLADWKAKTPWIDFLARDPAIRSNTSVCLKVVDPAITSLTAGRAGRLRQEAGRAGREGGRRLRFRAITAMRRAGLRIWCGATVEANDVALLTQWIDWAFAETKASLPKAA